MPEAELQTSCYAVCIAGHDIAVTGMRTAWVDVRSKRRAHTHSIALVGGIKGDGGLGERGSTPKLAQSHPEAFGIQLSGTDLTGRRHGRQTRQGWAATRGVEGCRPGRAGWGGPGGRGSRLQIWSPGPVCSRPCCCCCAPVLASSPREHRGRLHLP